MRRFRPNIVTTGSAPFAEDAWQQLTIANVDFEGVKPCSRCKVRLAPAPSLIIEALVQSACSPEMLRVTTVCVGFS
jgi:MOSC domain